MKKPQSGLPRFYVKTHRPVKTDVFFYCLFTFANNYN